MPPWPVQDWAVSRQDGEAGVAAPSPAHQSRRDETGEFASAKLKLFLVCGFLFGWRREDNEVPVKRGAEGEVEAA